MGNCSFDKDKVTIFNQSCSLVLVALKRAGLVLADVQLCTFTFSHSRI